MTKHSKVTERVDEEFAAQHGNTLAEGSLEDERHREINPQSPGEQARKLRLEAREGEGVLDKAKRALEELDRDISGEYERRQDRTAPPARPDRGR